MEGSTSIEHLPKDVLRLLVHQLADSRPRSRWGILATWRCVCRLFHSTISIDVLQQAMLMDLKELPQVKDCKECTVTEKRIALSYCGIHPEKMKNLHYGSPVSYLKFPPGRGLSVWPCLFDFLCRFLNKEREPEYTLLWNAVSSSYHIYIGYILENKITI